jgi:hypothetical protein
MQSASILNGIPGTQKSRQYTQNFAEMQQLGAGDFVVNHPRINYTAAMGCVQPLFRKAFASRREPLPSRIAEVPLR